MKLKKLLFLICALAASATAFAQDTDFWFAAPDLAGGGQSGCNPYDAPMVLVISNTEDVAGEIRITFYGNSSYNVTTTINPGDAYADTITTAMKSAVENPIAQAGAAANYGIHIESDVEVTAYYQILPTCNQDIYSLKGSAALGTEFYVSMASDSRFYNPGAYTNAYDQIDIVASEDYTDVTVNPTKAIRVGGGSWAAGTPLVRTLMKGQTLKIMEHVASTGLNSPSLAGTHILASKPIAVTTTEDLIGDGDGGWDVIGDQTIPFTSLGSKYVVIKGYLNTTERVYMIATESDTYITIDNGTPVTYPVLGAGGMLVHDMFGSASSVKAVSISANHPIYCYQVTGSYINGRDELGSAILPSVYTIAQQQLVFYQSTLGSNLGVVIYRTGKDDKFEITYDGLPLASLPVTVIPIPGISDWSAGKITLPSDANGFVVKIVNAESPFSFGYHALGGGGASYGYLSQFGHMSLPFDTLWICGNNQTAGGSDCSGDIELKTGVPMAEFWKWKIDNTDLPPSTHDTTIIANIPGQYSVIVDQGGYLMKDTCWLLSMIFDAKINPRLPVKPAKVTVPQLFNVTHGAAQQLPGGGITYHHWEADGGTVYDSDINRARVIWHSTGRRQLKLHLRAEGPGCIVGGVTYNRTCDTVLVYDVLVHPKNLGFFVDQNAPDENEHNGTSWETAFPTVQQALALASQGDYIWVADGDYSPRDNFPANADSANVYTGYYMCDYDSVRIYTGSYVMDWDSVQVFAGFSGYGEGFETNLNERDINAYPVILHGSDNKSPVVKIDGGTTYWHLDPLGSLGGVSRGARWDGVTVRDGHAQYGAGILFENGASGTISNSIVKQNAATGEGGGVYVGSTAAGEPPLLFGVEISGNTAENGAGIYNDGSDFLMVNTTVAGNLSSGSGGGLFNSSGSPTVRNSIVYGNRDAANDNTADVANYGSPYYRSSDIGGAIDGDGIWDDSFGINGGGNINMSPSFYLDGFNDRGSMQEGDYRLRAMSRKVVEGGYNSFLRIPYPASVVLGSPSPLNTIYADYLNRDLSGERRVNYEYVDMGAYEYSGEVIIPGVVYSVEVPVTEGVITIPAPGVYRAPSYSDFTLILTPREKSTSLRYVQVLTGSAWQDERGNREEIDNGDGTRTYIFHSITEPLKIRITGVITGSETVETASIWTTSKQLHIQTPGECVLNVYTLTGQVYVRQRLGVGKTSFTLPSGMYIVTLDGGKRERVVVP